ncbi:MAG: response regulator [Candidatus Heimdallarchaeota archaeon]|nr:response regulator [Candidatus Heimdallarchaeota archaeon]
MIEKAKILFIDDSENDVILLSYSLKEVIKNLELKRVDDLDSLERLLKKEVWDIIIIDNTLPTLSLDEALTLLKEKEVKAPIVCVSGVDFPGSKKLCNEKIAEAFVLKDEPKKFVSTIAKILKGKKTEPR